MFIEHAAEFPCRNVGDRSRVKLFDGARSTTVVRGKCPPPNR
jgi:hypothetical protein